MVQFQKNLVHQLEENLQFLNHNRELAERTQDINRVLLARSAFFNEGDAWTARLLDMELRGKYPEIGLLGRHLHEARQVPANQDSANQDSTNQDSTDSTVSQEIERLEQDYCGIVYAILCGMGIVQALED